jgi:hypothetical protein
VFPSGGSAFTGYSNQTQPDLLDPAFLLLFSRGTAELPKFQPLGILA